MDCVGKLVSWSRQPLHRRWAAWCIPVTTVSDAVFCHPSTDCGKYLNMFKYLFFNICIICWTNIFGYIHLYYSLIFGTLMIVMDMGRFSIVIFVSFLYENPSEVCTVQGESDLPESSRRRPSLPTLPSSSLPEVHVPTWEFHCSQVSPDIVDWKIRIWYRNGKLVNTF